MNNKHIISCFNAKGFDVTNYIYARNCIIYYISKDYSKNFNIEFDGNIILEVKIRFEFFSFLTPYFYPTFKEVSKIITKNIDNHIYPNGNICYAPPYRPIYEKWKFIDFVNAVDSMINNYLSKEYIGVGCLTELEHGQIGLKQYNNLIAQNNKKDLY